MFAVYTNKLQYTKMYTMQRGIGDKSKIPDKETLYVVICEINLCQRREKKCFYFI